MESTTAGYVDAWPVIAERLRGLAELRPPAPVLSLYLDLNPTDFGTRRARRSAYTSLLDEATRCVEDADTDHEGKVSLRADVERATAFFEDTRPRAGVAPRSSPARPPACSNRSRSPGRHARALVVDDSPYLTPLLQAADRRDWLIAPSHRPARFLHGNGDYVQEFEQIEDSVAGQHERSGPTDHQRWVEHEVDQHLEKAAHEPTATCSPAATTKS